MKKLVLALMAALPLFFTACDSHDHDHNDITITIESPTEGMALDSTNCGALEVHIDVKGTEELHDVEIKLAPENDPMNYILDVDAHSHDMEYHFVQTVDLCSFAAGTEFHVEVSTCKDHDCTEKATQEVHFSMAQ